MGAWRDSPGKNAALLTGLSALGQLLAFCYRVVLSRMVGAEVMGLYQLTMSACGVLMSLTAVGVTGAIANLSARYLALGSGRAMDRTRRLCLLLFAVGAALTASVTILGSDPISVYLLGDARTQLGLVILPACVLFTGIENIQKHVFYGAGRVLPPALADLAEQLIRAAMVLGLLVLFLPQNPERTVGLIVLGMTGCELCSAVTLTRMYRRGFARERIQGAGESRAVLLRQIGTIAVPLGLTALLSNLMEAINASLIPRKLVESGMKRGEATAQLGVLCGMTLPMLALPTVFLGAVNRVMTPRLARSAALRQPQQLQKQVRGELLTVSTLLLPAMAMMVVIGPDLARVLFRQERAGEYLLPLAAAMALSGYHGVFSGVLNAVGRQGESALIALVCDGVQMAFLFPMAIPGVGIRSYVAGTVVSSALGAVWSGMRTARWTGARLPLFQCLTAPGLGALLMGLNCNLLYRKLQDCGLPVLWTGGATLVFGAVLYLAALQAQGLSLRENLRLE